LLVWELRSSRKVMAVGSSLRNQAGRKGKDHGAHDNPAKRYLVFMDPGRVPDAKTLAEVKKLPVNEKYEKMTAKEAAQAFFDGFARKDVEEIRKFMDASDARRVTPKRLGRPALCGCSSRRTLKAKDAGCWDVPSRSGSPKSTTLRFAAIIRPSGTLSMAASDRNVSRSGDL